MNQLPTLSHHASGPAHAPWLTFVPGIGNDHTFWQFHAQGLADRFRVLTFDPWGHGSSPPPPENCRFDDVVAGVVQLWDELGIEQTGVVGLGFGGSVALSLGIQYPQHVGRIVACCCRPRQPEDRRGFWRARSQVAGAEGMEALADATVDRWLSPQFRAERPDIDASLRAMMKRTTVAGYQAYLAAFVEMDFEARLAELATPTLLIAAQGDHGGGPVDDMREMARRIPGALFEVLAGTGHICNHEAPDALARVLARFLVRG